MLLLLFVLFDPICGVMVGVLASSTVDRRFKPWLGKTTDHKIGICCFSAKHVALIVRRKTDRLGIRIMCQSQSGATCPPPDFCFR